MNKKIALYFSLATIVIFIIFMVYDSAKKSEKAVGQTIITTPDNPPAAKWELANSLVIPFGKLKAISTSEKGILVGGDIFLALYDFDYNLIWKADPEQAITALTINGDTIYAATQETILLYSSEGIFLEEWGPYEKNSIITSISASNQFIAFADAGNRVIFILDKKGAVKSIVGQPGDQFVIPSAYFDLFLSDKDIITANPGKRSVEFRTFSGEITSQFGEAGTALEYFCGCCNPSHFALMPDGNIVTAEKGINRIKIVDQRGELIELVAQEDGFMASVPVDLAVEGSLIFAANPDDSKLYIFKRK